MKKLFIFISLLIFNVIISFSQSIDEQYDVTKFLGIPVDGSKKEMINKLKDKGFKMRKFGNSKMLYGNFNNNDVYLNIQTNHDKVYRVIVFDANTYGSRSIKTRWNNLCYQFKNNPNYFSVNDYEKSEDENIDNYLHEQALFYQQPIDSLVGNKTINEMTTRKTAGEFDTLSTAELKLEFERTYTLNKIKAMYHKTVWFTIVDFGEGYRLVLYYENGLNKDDGSDL